MLGLLASSRSLNAAKTALRRIGLSGSEQDIETAKKTVDIAAVQQAMADLEAA